MTGKRKFLSWRISFHRLILLVAVAGAAPAMLLWLAVTQPMLPTSPVESLVAVEPARLEAHVRTISEKYFPRDAEHPENLDRVAAYIREQFERAGGKTAEQPYEADGATYRNVIARFGPETGELVVVGAHYDSCDELPAADDNASAVAGLIELAFLLKGAELKNPVELVAYTLEEPPYFGTEMMGSAVHAAALRKKNGRIRLMIALEMIGYFSDREGSQEFPVAMLERVYPSRGDFIAVVGKMDQMSAVRRVKKTMRSASSLPVYSMNAPAIMPGVDFSDHRNYWRQGFDAVMITDTAFYRNHNYHRAGDTPDTLDYRRMAMVVQGVFAAVKAFAE